MQGFIDKAEESLAGAASELSAGRYHNSANRAYYACFQAAIYALLRGGTPRPVRGAAWSHAFVQAEFVRLLIDRRKRYPTELRGTIDQCRALRVIGDYETNSVSRTQCQRSVRRARQFVDRITVQEKGLT